MKVKTLLSTLKKTEYALMTESGSGLEEGYVSDKYYDESNYEDSKVVSITTVANCDKLFITIK